MKVFIASAAALITVVAGAFSPSSANPASSGDGYARFYSGLRWRLIGPFRGGRALTVAGVAGSPTLAYFGAVAGGVWKTSDAGRTWNPIFDDQRIASIGAVAVAPSNPNIIYVGSGEADMRSDISYGNGVYKSIDGGKTWSHIGLDDTRQIGKILIDPRDPNVVYVAALGHAYGPNAERGVFRTTDGGSTWAKVLYEGVNAGAIDLAFAPNDSRTLYAALWQTRRPPWNVYPPSNGPQSGLYKSTDRGQSWRELPLCGAGPAGSCGRLGIAISPAAPRRVYVIADARKGGLYRSDDGGASWRLVNGETRLWERGWYFCAIAADAKNPATVYISDTAFYRSTDAGIHFTPIKGSPDGDDFHAIWIDPADDQHLVLGSDQGASVSLNGGATWSSWYNQPTGQFYHVAADSRFPFWVYGAQQDSGTASTPTRGDYLGLSFRDWRAPTGDESGYAVPDPLDPTRIFHGNVGRVDLASLQDKDITPYLAFPGYYRSAWTMPLAFSPANPHALYFGSQMLFRTLDGGRTWSIISPDLTRPNPGVPANLDATTAADNLRAGPRRGVIYAIAPSPISAREIWIGTDDGKVWLTRDDGKHWRDVTPPGLTAWSKVGMIEASRFDANIAYAAVDRHRLDDVRPYLYRTRDGGRTWARTTSGIADGAYVNVVREDPVRRGLLYAGTELGAYVSFDDGGYWHPLQLNLPVTSIRDFAIRDNSLVVATHGRAFWVLDDLSPLREVSPNLARAAAWLFSPENALRVRPPDDRGERLPPEEPAGQNRPPGAFIDYYLASAARGALVIEIRDSSGAVVRRYSSADVPKPPDVEDLKYPLYWARGAAAPEAAAGMHRFAWDMRYAAPAAIAKESGDAAGAWAPPGRYTVRLIVDGRVSVRPLVLSKDPRVRASDADLRAQFELTRAIENLRVSALSAYAGARSAADRLDRHAGTNASSRLARRIRSLAGAPPATSPDDSIGVPETSIGTLHYVGVALRALEDAVESADLAPTADDVTAYQRWGAVLASDLVRWHEFERAFSALRRRGEYSSARSF